MFFVLLVFLSYFWKATADSIGTAYHVAYSSKTTTGALSDFTVVVRPIGDDLETVIAAGGRIVLTLPPSFSFTQSTCGIVHGVNALSINYHTDSNVFNATLIDSIGYSDSAPRATTNTIIVCSNVRNARAMTSTSQVVINTYTPTDTQLDTGIIPITPIVPSSLGMLRRSLTLSDDRANANPSTLRIEIVPLSNPLSVGDYLTVVLPEEWQLNAAIDTPNMPSGGGVELEEEDMTKLVMGESGAHGGGGSGGLTSPNTPLSYQTTLSAIAECDAASPCILSSSLPLASPSKKAVHPDTHIESLSQDCRPIPLSPSHAVHTLASTNITTCTARQIGVISTRTTAGTVDTAVDAKDVIRRTLKIEFLNNVINDGTPLVIECTNVKPPSTVRAMVENIPLTTYNASGIIIDQTLSAVLGAVREADTPPSSTALLQAVVIDKMSSLFDIEQVNQLARSVCNGFAVVCHNMELRAQIYDRAGKSLVLEYIMTLIDDVTYDAAISIIQRLSPGLINELRYTLNVYEIAFVNPYQWIRKGSCNNNQQDESESDIDCGGPYCKQCSIGRSCRFDGDCESHRCKGLSCITFS